MAYPLDFGINFTKTTHAKAEGSTDPVNNKLPNNYVVAITGAGKGLGFHIALAYAKAGAHGISISSRTPSDLEKLKAEISNIDPKIDVLTTLVDTTKDADVKKLADEVKAHFGRVDCVVANAGIISAYMSEPNGHRRIPKGVVEDDDFERVVDINLVGTRRTAKYFVPLLAESKDGAQSFVIISSLASHLRDSQFCSMAYVLSKIASNRMAESMHNDHFEGEGVVTYAVHPGSVVTPQTQGHSNEKGDMWEQLLTDDIGLCGGWLTWLTKEKRPWLSGRFNSVTWDVDELEGMKDDIVKNDKLKFRMVV